MPKALGAESRFQRSRRILRNSEKHIEYLFPDLHESLYSCIISLLGYKCREDICCFASAESNLKRERIALGAASLVYRVTELVQISLVAYDARMSLLHERSGVMISVS